MNEIGTPGYVLDALIAAGWGDVEQTKIPADVIAAAARGYPVPLKPKRRKGRECELLKDERFRVAERVIER
jgi:hypothetical protein